MRLDIDKFKSELEEITQKIESPLITDKSGLYLRQSQLYRIIELEESLGKIEKDLFANQNLIELNENTDLSQLAIEDSKNLEEQKLIIENELISYIIPQDRNNHRNIILEIRAGTGGLEASLFAGELFRMYSRLANILGWNISVLSITESENNGIKEVISKITGRNVYKFLKYESGVHRVQRVPETEASGRLHTSAASVVVMPEVDDINIEIKANDIRIDVYRSGGHGGQSVNTTDSAVRITHLPTGMVVTCQDTKDQQKNKSSAMSVLKSRLYQLELEKQTAEITSKRKASIRSGDRSDKIKTYNFPQDRLTDHRIKKTWHSLDRIMDGEIKMIIEETIIEMQKIELEEANE